MKKFLLLFVLFLASMMVMAQSTQKITYQAVVRDGSNRLVVNTPVKVDVTITYSSGSYFESLKDTTNANGLMYVLIGGNPGFESIDWSEAIIKTVVTIDGGETVSDEVTVTAVPYALNARSSTNVNPSSPTIVAIYNQIHADSQALANHIVADSALLRNVLNDTLGYYLMEEHQMLSTSNDTLYLTGGSFVKLPAGFSGDYNELINKPDINNATLTIKNGTTDLGSFTANSNIDTDIDISSALPTANDATLTIQKNGTTVGTFTANQAIDQTVNITVPTCDSLNNCDLIQNILARLEKLELLNDSLFHELEAMKPALTLTASHDTVTVCSGSSQPVTYTAMFHNCSSSDYTISWKVNGTDSSNVTVPTFTFNAETAGDYVVICVATRSDNSSVTDTVTTHVEIDTHIPSFTATVNTLTISLSNIVNTAMIQWDTDSLPVVFDGTSAEHTYSVADTITITAISANGCMFSKGFRLQPTAPTVTTDNIPTSSIAATTAKAYGTVTSDGGVPETKRGMVYSTSNLNLKLGANGVDSVIANGTGKGSYSCDLTKLAPCTQYYVRAFAFNDVDTAYGEVKNFTTLPFTCGSTLTDIDGNEYATMLLGSQCWMKQNLRTTHFADGAEIPVGGLNNHSGPRRYAPDNNLDKYGYLYNWDAAMHGSATSSANPSGVQGVCPNGWHLPSDAEWTQLTSFVASNSANVCDNNPTYIAKSLVSTEDWGTWGSCSSVTTNNTGFSVLPAGTWHVNGASAHAGQGYFGGHTIFRTATGYEGNYVWTREFYTEYPYVDRTAIDKTNGLSVRCVLTCSTSSAYLPTVSVANLTRLAITVSMAASVISDGGAAVTERGVCWSTSPNPTISSTHTAASGTGIGDFTISEDLTPGTTYYVRAYATNSAGTAYGGEVTFQMPSLPTVTTSEVLNISSNTATAGGNVVSGTTVTSRGVCWSTLPNPAIADSHTSDGSGTGVFSSSLENLTGGTTYHVRAYATNDIGTAYGQDVSFTTLNMSLSITSDRAATIKMCGASSQTVTYTATPSYGDVGDYSYDWGCSNSSATLVSTTSNTATFSFSAAATYTVTCTAHHNPENFDVNATGSTTIQSGGNSVYLGLCSEGLTINSNEEINKKNYRFSYVGSISWGDGTSSTISNEQFSHTYATPGIYNVTVTSGSSYGNCEVTQTFAMGDIVTHPCNVANPHTNTSTYTSSTGGLETTNSEGKVTTVADNDGHTYNVVEIGSQCWMAENLRTTKNPDGTTITQGTSSTSSDASTAYWYEPSGGVSADPYGYLYNWTAVMNGESASSTNPSNVRGICPLGWHVPSSAEWDAMLSEVGTNNAGTLASGCGWKPDYNTSATSAPTKKTPGDYTYPERNSNGFGALGTQLNYENYFINAYFWTSTAGSYADYYRISYNNTSVSRSNGSKYSAYALRCVRD